MSLLQVTEDTMRVLLLVVRSSNVLPTRIDRESNVFR